MREAILSPAARAYRDEMSDLERTAIDRRIAHLEYHPAPDHVTTFAVPGVTGFLIYDDGEWRMSYAILNEATILIRSVAHILDLPS
ncbi:MAG: hypothetical protein AB7R89_04020 [Dehalococcoidia bacterium]